MASPHDACRNFTRKRCRGIGAIANPFRLADAQAGVSILGATSTGETSGLAKHFSYGYQGNDTRKNWLPVSKFRYCEFVLPVAVKAKPKFVHPASLGETCSW